MEKTTYSTKEVTDILGVSPRTLYRWLKAGKIPEPQRDRNQYRIFTKEDVEQIKEYAFKTYPPE